MQFIQAGRPDRITIPDLDLYELAELDPASMDVMTLGKAEIVVSASDLLTQIESETHG